MYDLLIWLALISAFTPFWLVLPMELLYRFGIGFKTKRGKLRRVNLIDILTIAPFTFILAAVIMFVASSIQPAT